MPWQVAHHGWLGPRDAFHTAGLWDTNVESATSREESSRTGGFLRLWGLGTSVKPDLSLFHFQLETSNRSVCATSLDHVMFPFSHSEFPTGEPSPVRSCRSPWMSDKVLESPPAQGVLSLREGFPWCGH